MKMIHVPHVTRGPMYRVLCGCPPLGEGSSSNSKIASGEGTDYACIYCYHLMYYFRILACFGETIQ
jgi:hypothetical protein